jgi:hypothetical protein
MTTTIRNVFGFIFFVGLLFGLPFFFSSCVKEVCYSCAQVDDFTGKVYETAIVCGESDANT